MDEAAVLEALGGRAEVARELGETVRLMHGWVERGFPAHSWHRLAELARRKGVPGITIETLSRPLWRRRAPACRQGTAPVEMRVTV